MYTAFCILFAIVIVIEIISISCYFECEGFDTGGIVAFVCLVLQVILGVVALFYEESMFLMSILIVILIAPYFIFMYSDQAVKWLEGLWNKDVEKTNQGTKTKRPLSKGFKTIGWVILIVAFLVFFGWIFDRSNTLVKQGERGVKTVAGKVVPKTYDPGLVTNLPFCERWGFDVIIVDIRPKTFEYNSLIRTKEQLKATIDYSVTCQINETKVHVMYDKYTDIENYKTVNIDHMMPSVMLMLTSKMSFWSFSDEATNLVTEAAQWILNDQLKADSLVTITNFYFKGYQASPEIEALIEQTAQARQGVELEKWKLERARIETEKVKQEAAQTYERLAAVAKANGIDVQIKADALKNPFVAQYEVAKALQQWNGSLTLPNTLAIMEQASNGGGGTSIFPIVPITTGK